jgi:hypothetical protein
MNNVTDIALQPMPDLSEAWCGDANPPFLSIITRTQGRRPHTLVEVLTCLAAQTDIDFELLLLGHRLDPDSTDLVLGLVDDCPAWLRDRVRYIAVPGGTRTRPLQVGLEMARGDYVTVLDDDDIIFAHWVACFRNAAHAMPDQVLRSNAVVQTVDTVAVQGMLGLRAETSPELQYPRTFNFFDHILENRSPPMTLAFPRQLVEQAGLSFDEALTTTEDWDFFMRCASIIGVADAGEITSVYRWWNKGESSRTLHLRAEWQDNHHRIWKNWDRDGFRLPPGSTGALVKILREHADFKAELQRQQQQGATLKLDPVMFRPTPEQRLAVARLRVAQIQNSTSWRVTWPLRRWFPRFSGAPEIAAAGLQRATAEQAEALVYQLYHSRAWRVAAPIRFLRRLADWFIPRAGGRKVISGPLQTAFGGSGR